MRLFYAVAMIALVAPASGAVAHEKMHDHLKFVHPYTVEPADGSTDTMVMMTITNTGGGEDALPEASTAVSESATIASVHDAEGKKILVPKDGRVELTKSGSHILLKGLRKVLVGYERFPLTLKFEKSGAVEVEVMVEERE